MYLSTHRIIIVVRVNLIVILTRKEILFDFYSEYFVVVDSRRNTMSRIHILCQILCVISVMRAKNHSVESLKKKKKVSFNSIRHLFRTVI